MFYVREKNVFIFYSMYNIVENFNVIILIKNFGFNFQEVYFLCKMKIYFSQIDR